jgi:protein ImuA
MMPSQGAPTLTALRSAIERIGKDGAATRLAAPPARAELGILEIDQALGGGLPRGALHALRPTRPGEEPAATGFALACALRLAGIRPLLWVRQAMAEREYGLPYGPGLAGFGLDPSRLVCVEAADARAVLKAAEEALHCKALGAVLVEPWGAPKAVDLVALRRLVLAAEASGVSALFLRSGGPDLADPGATRWAVAAHPSRSAFGPGLPAFRVMLERGGRTGPAEWMMEWSCEQRVFRPAHSGARLPLSRDRQAETVTPFRRAG